MNSPCSKVEYLSHLIDMERDSSEFDTVHEMDHLSSGNTSISISDCDHYPQILAGTGLLQARWIHFFQNLDCIT